MRIPAPIGVVQSLVLGLFFVSSLGKQALGQERPPSIPPCEGGKSGAEAPRLPLPEGLVLKAPQIPSSVTGTLRSLNETLSRDLSPADNAAVLLLQLFGDESLEPELRSATLEMLGIHSLSKTAPRFIYLEPFAKTRSGLTPEQILLEVAQLNEQLRMASERPWTRNEFPALADYLTANRAALETVVIASHRPRYYAPLLSLEKPPRLLSAAFNIDRRLPFVARVLAARARLRSTDQVTHSVDDLLACQRLAVLLAVGSPLDVSHAKAALIDSFACNAAIGMLQSGQLTSQEATTYLKGLDRIPRLPSPALAADVGERAALHQEIELLQTDKASVEGFFEVPGGKDAHPLDMDLSKIQWELAHKRADELQNQIVRALSIRDREEQQSQFKKLDEAHAAWDATANAKTGQLADAINKDPAAASRWIGESMAMALRPRYWQRRLTDDRARSRRDLVTIGMALIAFRREQGEFPAALSQLAPQSLPTIPMDAHSDAPFHYVRLAKDRARLVSWGVNRIDDAGSNYNDDQTVELR